MAALNGLVLVVEAATENGSLALLRVGGGRVPDVVGAIEVPMGSGSRDVLTPALSQLLLDTGVSLDGIVAVVCGSGPGSFTSLRIAGAFAKGIVFGLDVPMYAVPSLLLALGDEVSPPEPGIYNVTLDALRGELYVQRVNVSEDGRIVSGGEFRRELASELSERAGQSDARVVHVSMRSSMRVSTRENASASVHANASANATANVHANANANANANAESESVVRPRASSARWLADLHAFGPVAADAWEPSYGRLAEAQVKWEASHGRTLVVD